MLVDGRARPKSYRLEGGEELEVVVPEPEVLEPEQIALALAYEDEHLLVVDKPAGLVVHPAGGYQSGTLVHGLLALGAAGGEPERPGIVHRLDRDTSGLLVVARSEEAHARLSRADPRAPASTGATSRSSAERRARAPGESPRRSAGIAATGRGTRSTPTRPARRSRGSRCASGSASGPCSTCGSRPGRTHQIRVHLEALELPVCGDPVYGVARDLGLERQFLHADRLSFEHPFTGAHVALESPLPPDLSEALARARNDA